MPRRGKAPRTDSERTRVSQLSHENKKLKSEIKQLRKTIERLNSGWCPGCLKKYEQDDFENNGSLPAPETVQMTVPNRICYSCNTGKLVLIKYYKMGECWYIRRCDVCKKQTKGKKYTPNVMD